MSIGGVTATWDNKGNLATEPQSGKSYTYWSENMLKTASGGATLYYDPLQRLTEYDTSVSARFVHDGMHIAAEVDNPAGAIQHRYVWGDGPDELIVDYSGSGTSNRRFASTDERASIISLTDSSGALVAINSYDEYGKPGSANQGRFQYTGQMWLPETGAYNYKARNYVPQLGIFAQTDPIGPVDSANLYAYVRNDPINSIDPLGLQQTDSNDADKPTKKDCGGDPMQVFVCGQRPPLNSGSSDSAHVGVGVLTPTSSGPLTGDLGTPAECADPSACIFVAAPNLSPNFLPPTHKPQLPPKTPPPGFTDRVMGPTTQYPNGYWVRENALGQPVDITTNKPPSNVTRPEARAMTHNPLPELPKPESWTTIFKRWGPFGIVLYGVGIIEPSPLY